MTDMERLASILKASRRLVVFTGAGISVPSGIPDFRSADGLYNRDSGLKVRPEEIISRSFFDRRPELFYEFYRSAMIYPDAKPNEAHRFFASLEKDGRDVAVVTQNIDGLHQAAGSSRVFELHGSVLRNLCMKCGAKYGLDAVLTKESVPHCPRCGGVIKPDVVLYEEGLDNDVLSGAVHALRQADTLIVAGTSLTVYPAAGLIHYFRGSHLVLINRDATPMDAQCDLVIHDSVGKVLGSLA